jgi:proteasome lid subunit RPN8/RPN11
MDALRKAAEQALEALEVPLHTPTARKQAWDAINALRAELAEQEQATGKDSFTVDWMKQALTVVWNFPSHPGFHPADSSADQDGEDPTSAWRAGWIAAVGAMQDAVRHVTPDPQEQAEQEQEPVAWRWKAMVNGDFVSNWVLTHSEPPPYALESQPLYTHPPHREWQGLTEEEVEKLWRKWVGTQRPNYSFFNAIEAALKEKNNG